MAALYPSKVTRIKTPLLVGDVRIFTIDWSPLGTPSAQDTKAYVKGESTDLTSTLLTGSGSLSGAVQTLETLTIPAGYGGKTIRLVAQATIGSETVKSAIEIVVQAAEGG